MVSLCSQIYLRVLAGCVVAFGTSCEFQLPMMAVDALVRVSQPTLALVALHHGHGSGSVERRRHASLRPRVLSGKGKCDLNCIDNHISPP